MDSDFNACVGYAINVTIFTKKVEGSGEACLNLGFIKSLVGRVTDGDGSPPELKGMYLSLFFTVKEHAAKKDEAFKN